MRQARPSVKTTVTVIILSLAFTAFPVSAYAKEYQDYDTVMNTGISLQSDKVFKLARPTKNTTVTAENYYITGSSNPEELLLCNGEEIKDRGIYGSFGVYAPLAMGDNVFEFVNGDHAQTLTITRVQTSSASYVISDLKQTFPVYDDLIYSGAEYTLRCTAPANAKVSATLNGESYRLTQEAIATSGVEAYYSAKITMPEVEAQSFTKLGKVSYTLSYEGKSSSKEALGNLYLAGERAEPVVKVSQNAATLYEEGKSTANFVSTLSQNAVDKVVDANSDFYQLSMGAWIRKDYVTLQQIGSKWQNTITDATYAKEGSGELLTLYGSVAAPFKAYDTSEKVSIKFYNTSGLSSLPKAKSSLFSAMDLIVGENEVTLDFTKKSPNSLIGFDVDYEEDGNIQIYFNPMPVGFSSEKPLKGTTIVVDPGHGGYDSGALGVLYGNGPYEKDITLATGIATKNRLESLGAKVILTVDPSLKKDKKVELTDRIQMARENRADFFLSLHCNSIAENANGVKPNGTEIYYYENNSKLLADKMLQNITAYTGRNARSVNYAYYYVTRNSLSASMLIEMGFVSNPVEYDALRNPKTIFKTANAIGDTLVSYLK